MLPFGLGAKQAASASKSLTDVKIAFVSLLKSAYFAPNPDLFSIESRP
ncbi:MAG: hypothetical protein ACJAZW_002617 [Maritalea sp.]|jgi:hypothetical protein